MTFRRYLKIFLTLLLVGSAAVYVFRAPLSLAVAKHVAASRMAVDTLKVLPDGLYVGLCGAGSPMPDDKRMGACTAVVAGKRLFVFDTGNGSTRNLGKMGFVHGHIEAIFLTHFHSDHIDGLGELLMQRWVSTGNASPVPIYGPPGVEKVVEGFMWAYGQDGHYRTVHHGDATVPASGFGAVAKPFIAPTDGHVRINYKGRSVVISGDTVKSAAVQREAKGVDLLVHEAMSTRMMALLEQGAATAGRPNVKKLMADIVDYHTSPEQAAEIARDAGVRYLLLNHTAPPLPLPGLEKAFLGDAPGLFNGPIQVGSDGDFFTLPVGSTQVKSGRLF